MGPGTSHGSTTGGSVEGIDDAVGSTRLKLLMNITDSKKQALAILAKKSSWIAIFQLSIYKKQ